MSKNATDLLNTLSNLEIINNISLAPSFHDEPHFFNFSCQIKIKEIKKKDKSFIAGSNGFSFYSNEQAILKSLAEAIERYCLYTFTPPALPHKSFSKDSVYPVDEEIKPLIKNWTKGRELTSGTTTYIPTQLISIGPKHDNETEIQERNSNGAAFAFNKDSAILSGIYEIIERDSFLTYYLTHTPPKKIRISSIKNQEVHRIVKYIKRYKLEVHLFDITTDLGIPTFLTFLIDQTELGPSIVLGMKCSLNIYDAILGSFAEALQLRPWLRYKKIKFSKIKLKQPIRTIQDRTRFWYSKDKLKLLDFFLNQKPTPLITPKPYPQKKELSLLLDKLAHMQIKVYAVDISKPIFPKDFIIYKILLPELQPLYLDETKKRVNMNRLKRFLNFWKVGEFSINQIPHPFL